MLMAGWAAYQCLLVNWPRGSVPARGKALTISSLLYTPYTESNGDSIPAYMDGMCGSWSLKRGSWLGVVTIGCGQVVPLVGTKCGPIRWEVGGLGYFS